MTSIVLYVFISIILGYFTGCLNPAFVIGKLRGVDVRKDGSGNAGASNTVILIGKAAGFFVAVFDILKTLGIWKLCAYLFPSSRICGAIAGISCAFGHMFNVFLKFKGGKGFACLGGIVLACHPLDFPIMLGIAILIAVTTNYIAFAAVSMWLIYPVYFAIRYHELAIAAILLIPLIPVFLRHRPNFQRMRDGRELRFSYLWNRNAEAERLGVDIEEIDANRHS